MQENTHRPRGAPKCPNHGHFQSSTGHKTETSSPALRPEHRRPHCLLPGRAPGRIRAAPPPFVPLEGLCTPGLDFVSPLSSSRRGTNQRLRSGFGGAKWGSSRAVGRDTDPPPTPHPAAGLLLMAPKDSVAQRAVPAHVASWGGRWEPNEGRSRAALLPHSEARGGGEDGGTSPERIPAAAAPFPKATAAYAMSDARPSAPTNFGICAQRSGVGAGPGPAALRGVRASGCVTPVPINDPTGVSAAGAAASRAPPPQNVGWDLDTWSPMREGGGRVRSPPALLPQQQLRGAQCLGTGKASPPSPRIAPMGTQRKALPRV